MSSKKDKLKQAILTGKIKDSKSALEFVLKEKEKENLIKELLPEIMDIPKGEDGHTPTKEELLKLIEPLIDSIDVELKII
jgi:hypothetical protein